MGPMSEAKSVMPIPTAASHRMMTNVEPALEHFWHPVALSGEVGPKPFAASLLGKEWVLVRIGEELCAFEDRCPHRWFPLSAGEVVDGTLECPYHGYRFSSDGRCVLLPARGPQASIPSRADLKPAWGVTERFGLVWLAPKEPRAELPDMPEWDDPAFGKIQIGPVRWTVDAALATDNFLDVSHFPFVHRGTFGDPDDALVPEFELERDGLSFTYGYRHLAVNPEEFQELHDTKAADQERVMRYQFIPPFTVLGGARYLETGTAEVVLVVASPERMGSTRIYSVLLGNEVTGDPEASREYEEKILREDQDMLERFTLDGLPLDPAAQFHSRADRMTVEYRRVLQEIVEPGA
jgi:phenylpropionate dioxygenase-like ring-hydroxylating dioxygenase large terminal subunit